MIVKTFTGETLREALHQVRESFGADAVILDTRFERNTGNRVTGANQAVSVTAAFEPEGYENAAVSEHNEGPHTLHMRGELAQTSAGDAGGEATSSAALSPGSDLSLPVTDSAVPATESPATGVGEDMARRIDALMSELRNQRRPEPSGWNEFRRWLGTQPVLSSGMTDAFAAHLAESLPPLDPFVENRTRDTRVLIVGNRGCGKSVVLLKSLASRWQRRQRKPSLCVVSGGDDHGHDRLAAMAESCGLEFAAAQIAGGKVTSGRLPRSGDAFAEFMPGSVDENLQKTARALRRAFKPHIVILAVNATGTLASWRESLKRFGPFEPTHLIVTHWDEAQPWFELTTFLRSTLLRLAYRTEGFEPFDEFEPFTETDIRTGLVDHFTTMFAGNVSSPAAFGGAQ